MCSGRLAHGAIALFSRRLAQLDQGGAGRIGAEAADITLLAFLELFLQALGSCSLLFPPGLLSLLCFEGRFSCCSVGFSLCSFGLDNSDSFFAVWIHFVALGVEREHWHISNWAVSILWWNSCFDFWIEESIATSICKQYIGIESNTDVMLSVTQIKQNTISSFEAHLSETHMHALVLRPYSIHLGVAKLMLSAQLKPTLKPEW